MAVNNVLKDKLGKILNPKIPRYELLKYDLVTNGNPVKTGQKVNSKDEYVAFISCGNLPNNSAKKVDCDLDFNSISITRQIAGYRKDSNNQVTNIPDNSNSGIIRFYINDVGLFISTNYNASSWIGYFYVYFIHNS